MGASHDGLCQLFHPPWHNWHNGLAEAKLAQQSEFSGERLLPLALWGRRRGLGWDDPPVRAFFVSLVATNRGIDRIAGQPAPVVRAAPAA
jgi:hypothetical protein